MGDNSRDVVVHMRRNVRDVVLGRGEGVVLELTSREKGSNARDVRETGSNLLLSNLNY